MGEPQASKNIQRQFHNFDACLEASPDLQGLWRAGVHILAESIPTAFAMAGLIMGMVRVRRALGIRSGERSSPTR